MQRILMTADAVGGVWTYAIDLCRTLGDRGIEVTLAVMGPGPSDAQCADARSLPLLTMCHIPFRLEWMKDAWPDVDAAGAWLLDLEDEVRPDIVHLNGYCHGTLPWRAPVLMAGHSCVLSWWTAVHGTEAPAEWDRYAGRVRRGLSHADLVVAPTAAMLGALNVNYGPLRRTRVISNGRCVHEHAPTPASGSGLPASGPRIPDPGSRPFVFSSGRLWDPAKNIELLAYAASEIPWPVYVAGDVVEPSGAPAVSLPNVHALGRLTSADVRAWMRAAAIYALPARYEPFGLSALEAALAGCALVLGDIRSLREVWGDAALYVPVDNRRALIAALRTCIDDAGLREDLAGRARRRARALTAERMTDEYCAAYEELAASTVAA